MKLWKRAGSLGLSLALCAGLVLPALAHTVTINGGDTQQVDTVQEGVSVIEASQSKTGTITMTEDEPDSSVTIGQGNVTLDLNGNTLTNGSGTAITVSGGELTIQDSGTGGAVSGGQNGVEVGNDKAEITGGTVSGGQSGVYVHGGEATISGDATVTGKTGVEVEDSTFTMDGGTVGSTVGGGNAIAGTGTIELTGGTLYGKVPEDVDISNVTVKDGPYVPPAPDPAPASDPLTRPAAARTLLEELFRRAGGSGELWSWAVENGLIDEDGDGDEIVTEALLRSILTRYAEAFGGNAVAAEDLTTLTGEDTDVVDNCRAVLNEFFGG